MNGRRRRELRRGVASLSLVAFAALIALTFAYSYDPFDLRGQASKGLENQANYATAASESATESAAGDAGPIVAMVAGSVIDPVARATTPEGPANGSYRVAASLIAHPSPEAPSVTAVAMTADESRGEPARGASDSPIFHVTMMTPLTPATRNQPRAKMPATPWRAYAQPFDRNDPRPRLAMVVAGTDDNMDRAIDTLPAAVTLALDPYARRLPDWIELARAKGHEVLLTLSMPSIDRGRRDAGPTAILASLDPKENLERLDWALGRTSGFVGVLDMVVNRPADETGAVLARLQQQGLMLVSAAASGVPAALPLATGDAVLTPTMSRQERQLKLRALEAKAERDGHALAIEIVSPASLGQLAAWLARLGDKSIVLAPATALIAKPPSAGIAQQ
jgi:hypothetical protein